MNGAILQHLCQIQELCVRFGVSRLELFGSAAGPTFDPGSSDFDFLAEFENIQPGSDYGVRYLDFAAALESVLGRRVDILTPRSIKNPYFQRAIDETRVLVFDARSQVTAV